MNEEEFLLKWNNHQTNFVDVFRELLGQSSFIDVSLVCGGEVFPAHKVILAACSPLLHNLFKENPCQHPVVILNDVPARDMKAMMKFIYQGEVSVSQTELASFLKTADNLQIKGLAEDREKDREREERKRKEKDSDAKSEGRVNKRQRTSDHNSNRELAMSQSNKAHKESYSSHNKNKSSSRSTSEDRICNSIAQYGIQPSVGIRTIPPPPHPTHPPTGNENDSSSANSQSVPPTSQAHSIPPKEETLMIKTEPFLDYHGEMVWQEGSEELDGNTQGPETINASEGLPLTDGHADSQVPAGMQEGQEGMPAPEMGEGGKYAEDMRGDANANNNEDPSQTAPATGDWGPGLPIEAAMMVPPLPPGVPPPPPLPPLSSPGGLGLGMLGPLPPSGSLNNNVHKCQQCSFVSTNPYTFARHLRIHSGTKEFKCRVCHFASSRKDSLIRHFRMKHLMGEMSVFNELDSKDIEELALAREMADMSRVLAGLSGQ